MEDMAGKISELLSDPEGLNKIRNLAQSLFSDKTAESEPKESCSSDTSQSGFSLPEGIDPIKIMNLFSAFNNRGNDNRSQLLLALKPHLTIERQERVDKAVKLLKIASLIPVLKNEGLLDLF